MDFPRDPGDASFETRMILRRPDSDMRTIAALATALSIALTAPSFAAGEGPHGWQTWTWEGSCFAVVFPEAGAIEALQSKKAYVALKHTPAEKTTNSISFISGLENMAGVEGVADIDGKEFTLLVYDGAGFVSSGQRENALLDAMIAGSDLKITWTGKDSMVVQNYKLSGLSQAKKTIDTACNVGGQ